MKTLAKGKDEVLAYLEAEANARSGQVGQYMLTEDDAGNLIAFIAGYSFIGSGAINFEGTVLSVVRGLVVTVTKP